MLVLLSMALVLIATVLLVLGLLNDDGLNLIYLSILSSLAAFGVLLFALRANRSRTERRPALPEALAALEPDPEREPATVGAAAGAGAAVTAVHPSPAPAAASTSGSQGEWHASDLDDWSEPTAVGDDAADEVEDGWQEGDEVEFPIADYDSLTVGQILPLLPQLYSDEFDVVEERERATKARPQVLAKLAELRDGGVSADPLASYTEPVATEADEEEEWFPIEDYESLSAAQIQPLLPELDEEELELVRARELELGRRRSLLDEIDRLLGDAPAAPAPAPPPATSKAAAAKAPAGSASRKAPAKRAASTGSAKKAAAKKPAATKRSTPTKQATTAKKASTTKAPAKKAPAKKAPAKKAPAKKAPAKKAPASKPATASKKAAPAKQAATKTSSAKKAAAKKSTAKKTAAKKAAAPAKKAAKPTKRSTKR